MSHTDASTSSDDHAARIPLGSSISSCLCFNVEFSEIIDIAAGCANERESLAEAHRRTRCGSRCGLCIPYIQLAIKTGRSAFPVLWAGDFIALGIDPNTAPQIQDALEQGTYTVND